MRRSAIVLLALTFLTPCEAMPQIDLGVLEWQSQLEADHMYVRYRHKKRSRKVDPCELDHPSFKTRWNCRVAGISIH